MSTEWRPLTWLNPLYEVSDTGAIRSWNAYGAGSARRESPRYSTLYEDRDGYIRVSLQIDKKPRAFVVHRLVLRAFTGVEGEEANHRDGDRTNNSLVNLEWCTKEENNTHKAIFRRATMTNPEPFVPIEDLAKHFTVSVSTVRAWVRQGLIPKDTYIKVGNTYRFNVTKVVNALTAAPKDEPEKPEPKVEAEETPVQLELDLNPDQDI